MKTKAKSSICRNLTPLMLAFLAAAAVIVPAQGLAQEEGQETITWRLQSHWSPGSTSFDHALPAIQKKFNKCSDGRLVLDIYPAGALFGPQQIFSAVKRGVIAMGTVSPAYLRGEASLAGIAAGLPFAFRNIWELLYYFKDMGFEAMLREQIAEHGVAYFSTKALPTEMVVKEPIESWEDFTSLTIRSSGVFQIFLSRAGAAASYIPGGELYTALSSGVVDAAHWGDARGAVSRNLFEVAEYLVQPALGIGVDAMVINQEALDALPPEIGECVVETMNTFFWQRSIEYIYVNRLARAHAVQDLGVEINQLPPEVVNRLTAIAVESWEEQAEKGPEAAEAIAMLKEFLASLGRLPSGLSDSQAEAGATDG